MSSFGPIAPHYDDLMTQVPYETWADYLELLIVHQEVAPQTLLDVACGTGSVAEIMALRGYEVSGFDLSSGMIEKARQKTLERESHIDYFVADACTVDLGKTFDAAYSFFDSLNYITSLEGLRAACQQIGKHIRPGGLLVFDLNTETAFEEEMFTQQDRKKRTKVQYDWKGAYDRTTRIIRVEMDFWVNGELLHETHVQRAHTDDEVRAALVDAGFEQIQCFESYTLDRPRAASDRVHYTAIKRKSP